MSTDIKVDLDRLVAEMHDPEEPAAVVQAYLKLVDCIATHRHQRTLHHEDRRDSQKHI